MHNINRTLQDIQVQADKIISQSATLQEMKQFEIYHEEIKAYLFQNTENELVSKLLKEMPPVFEETTSNQVAKGVFSAFFAIMFSWATAYFQEQQEIENALDNIKTIRGKYSSIEFLLK